MEILNMFNTGSQLSIKLVVESADLGLESDDSSADCRTDCSADSNVDPAKVGVQVRAFRHHFGCFIHVFMSHI